MRVCDDHPVLALLETAIAMDVRLTPATVTRTRSTAGGVRVAGLLAVVLVLILISLPA
ncbi:MAG: hypothetical protein IT340_09605 [Chloroflexi bacterium]|nr:hypothetical protein [Chloroflexota bacterium]